MDDTEREKWVLDQHRAHGYEWVLNHKHWERGELLEYFKVHEETAYEEWTRGAYDALIGLGIVSELGSISAAALVGCNRDAINKAIKAGNLKAKKVDKTYVINPLDLELWDKSANRKRRKKA